MSFNIILFIIVASTAVITRAQLESGPMVGHTTHNSALIWAYAG